MLKRVGKSSYNPYSSSQRVKKAEAKGKDRLDILPNKHNVWLKQVRLVCVCILCLCVARESLVRP